MLKEEKRVGGRVSTCPRNAGSNTKLSYAAANPCRTLLKITKRDVSKRFTSSIPGGRATENSWGLGERDDGERGLEWRVEWCWRRVRW